jgi:hypothetical protein
MYMGEDSMPKAYNNAYNSYPSEFYHVVREVLHRISDIDYQHHLELGKVDTASSDEALKNYIKDKVRWVHQKQRQPYVDLLRTLRLTQQR